VVTDCNCSICRRYGTLWAYYRADQVRVRAARGATRAYVWGVGMLRFVRCATCGCVSHWERVRRDGSKKVGVNARNLDPAVLTRCRVRKLDAAAWPLRVPPSVRAARTR
jgi:hypothetical protein